MSEKDKMEMSIKVQVRYLSEKRGYRVPAQCSVFIPTPWGTGAADWGRLSHLTVKDQLMTD
jgi:hypothetical protein